VIPPPRRYPCFLTSPIPRRNALLAEAGLTATRPLVPRCEFTKPAGVLEIAVSAAVHVRTQAAAEAESMSRGVTPLRNSSRTAADTVAAAVYGRYDGVRRTPIRDFVPILSNAPTRHDLSAGQRAIRLTLAPARARCRGSRLRVLTPLNPGRSAGGRPVAPPAPQQNPEAIRFWPAEACHRNHLAANDARCTAPLRDPGHLAPRPGDGVRPLG